MVGSKSFGQNGNEVESQTEYQEDHKMAFTSFLYYMYLIIH